MDPIAVILAALKAGALFVGEKMASEAVKDSYAALKRLLTARVKTDEDKAALLPAQNVPSDVWQAKATEILEQIGARGDREIVDTAQKLLTQVNQTQTSSGKFNLQANTIGTVLQGDFASIVFQSPGKKTGGE